MNIKLFDNNTWLLLTLLGLFVFVVLFIFISPSPKKAIIIRAVYKADHTRLLAECRAPIAATESLPRDESKCGAPWIRTFDKTDPLLFRREMREIASLNPSYVSVSDKEVMICLSALPRIYLLAVKTNVQEFGAKCITNGLWLSNSPAEDREEAIRQV